MKNVHVQDPVRNRHPFLIRLGKIIFTSLLLLSSQFFTPVNGQTYDPEVWKVQPWVKQSTLDKGLIGGEGGQWGIALTIDPIDGNLMFLGTDVGGIWRSLDGGATWNPSNAGLSARGASGFAIDPNNINRVLTVGANSGEGFQNQHGIYLSTNKGASWQLRLPLRNYCGFRDNAEHITYDKASFDAALGYSKVAYWSRSDNGGNCQSGSGPFLVPGLYKSTNGGTDWAKIPNSDSLGGGVVKTHPTTGAVYIGNKRGFYKSSNGGTDFVKTFTQRVYYMSAPTADKIFLLTKTGLYLSTNGGDNFQPVASNNFPAQFTPFYLNVSPVNPNRMLLQIKRSTFDDVRYFTEDGGLNWQPITVDKVTDNFLPYNNGVSIYAQWHPTRENEVWTFGSNIVLRSTNGGRNFGWAGNGISHTFVSAGINWSTTQPNVLATPTQDWNSALTTDGGRTWTYLPVSGLSYGYNYGAYSSNGQVVVVGNATENYLPRKIAVSRNGGTSFTRTELVITGKEVGYGDPHDSRILFLGNFRSIDEGVTWQNMGGCDGVFTSSPTGAKELYGVKGTGLVRSDDRGATWATLGNVPNGIQDLAYDHIRNRLYVACGDNNFYQFDVRTRQVTSLASRIPADQFGNKRYNAVAVDPIDPTVVYLGSHRDIYSTDVALVRSVNAGQTWQILTVAPRHNNPQYGLTGGYETQVIRVNPVNRSLFVGTNCFGNWKFGPPAVRLPTNDSKPDLYTSDVRYPPALPAIGQPVSFTAVVKNRGAIATSGPAVVDVRVDSVQLFRYTSAAALAPGDSAVITATTQWTAIAGSHTVQAVADPDGTLAEQSEVNNTNATTVLVPAVINVLPPANLRTLATEANFIILGWDASVGTTVQRFDIYRDSLAVGSVPGSAIRYTATGLTKNTEYGFYVKAIYETGAEATSNPIRARTAASLYAIAEKTPTPVVLDGELNEAWKFSNALTRIPATGQSSDNFTTFALLWDNDNLYVAAKVLDTTRTTRTSAASSDGLDLFVDGNRSKAVAIFTQDWAVRQAIDRDTVVSLNQAVNARARFVQSKTKTIPGGYVTEFSLPWRYLFNDPNPNATSGSPIPFNVGKIIGFELVNRDNDNSTGLRGSVTWRSNTEREFNEASWGDAVLTPAGGDQTAPNKPANLRTDQLYSTSLRLLWDVPSDDVGVIEYRVYRNNVFLATTATNRYTVKGLSPLTAYQFTVEAVDVAGRISPVSDPFSISTPDHLLATAVKTTTRPTVNGLLDEPEWQLSYPVDKAIFGTKNNTTTFGTLWTTDTLYVGVQVLDARLYNNREYFNTDAVEIYLDGGQNRTATYDANDRQFVQVYNGGLFGSNQAGIVSRRADIGGGYSIEMAIPWSNLSVTAADNLIIGFDLANNDDDTGGGRTIQTMWNGNDNNYLTSVAFGRLKLAPAVNTTLTLTSFCSANPTLTRRWRVKSTYATPVNFTWDVYGSTQTGSGTVPAGGTIYFETQTVGDSASSNTLRLSYLGKTTVKASSGSTCPPGGRVAAETNEGVQIFQVYPNPSDGNFTLRYESPTNQNVQVSMLNVLGQAVYRHDWPVKAGRNSLPVESRPLPTGTYLLRLQTETGDYLTNKLLIR